MPNPDTLARCHTPGKRHEPTGAVTLEILFFPSGDSVGHVNTLTGEKQEAAGVIGEVIFHMGESHFRLGLREAGLGGGEQAEALTAACHFWHNVGMSHLGAAALHWPKYNLHSLTLPGSPRLMSKPFQLCQSDISPWGGGLTGNQFREINQQEENHQN